MGKKIFLVLGLTSALSWASPAFWTEARRTIDDTWSALYQCRLARVSPYDPHLPKPMVAAREAVVNQSWRLLAYYDEEWFSNATTMVFKNPDGTYRHTVSFNDTQIQVATPYAGVVAWASRTGALGNAVQYFCRGYQVSEWDWRNCVTREYVNLVSSQLCRFP